MGILKHLLFWPVTGPSFLLRFSLDKVHGVVQEELTDDARIKAQLMELQLALELGDIDEAEYVAREAEVMQQLREIRDWREYFGMSVSGGPVRVQSGSEAADVSAAIVAGDMAEEAGRAPRVADPGSASIELSYDEG